MSEHAWTRGRPLRSRAPQHAPFFRTTAEIAAGACAASVFGYLIEPHALLAILGVAGFAAVAIVTRPKIAAVALGASIPALENLASAKLGVHVSLSDLLLVLLMAQVLGSWAATRDASVMRALRPVAFPVLQYCGFLALLLVAHAGLTAAIQTGQRLELVAFPLAIGSYLALKSAHIRLLQTYVVAATALAIVWPFDSLQLQKNSAGQLIANAILLVVGIPSLARLRPCIPVLIFGLLATASRGAIVAGAVGLLVIFLAQGVGAPWRTLVRATALGVTVLVIFQLMPSSIRARVTSFKSGVGTPTQYNVHIRNEYKTDALHIIRAHPWLGIGVGSYLAGDPGRRTSTVDPHEVILLQAAEGGWLFAGSFVVLVLGSVFALRRFKRIDLAPATAGVVIGTAAHGLFDVYWVRGTPVLGWLMVGMTCALFFRSREVSA